MQQEYDVGEIKYSCREILRSYICFDGVTCNVLVGRDTLLYFDT